MSRLTSIALAAGISLAVWTGAQAAEHEVRMLNKGPEGQPMQFDPAFLKIEPGVTVKFVATDKGHNSESILEMIPEGADTWKGKINEEISATFTEEGMATKSVKMSRISIPPRLPSFRAAPSRAWPN